MINKKERILNEWINLREARAKREILHSWPVSVNLPVGSRCNLECTFCKRERNKSASNFKDLSFKAFLKYPEPLKFASLVAVYSWGEPFLNPHYDRFLEYIKTNFKGITIQISTNIILLNQRWIERLISFPDLEINISLNAATRKTYLLLTKRDKFIDVIKNIGSLVKAHKVIKNNLRISLSYVMTKQNIEEFPMFINLASELGVATVIPLPLMLLEKKLLAYSLDGMQEKAKQIISEAKNIAKKKKINISSCVLKAVNYERDNILDKCIEPWRSFKVNLEGDVKVCCHSSAIAGNIFKQSVKKIWNGEVFRFYRRRVNSSSPPSNCALCPVKNPFRFSTDIHKQEFIFPKINY